MIKKIFFIFKDFLDLFYPDQCVCCQTALLTEERLLCLDCLSHLPKTDYHLTEDNPIARLFWGRTAVFFAAAFLFFTKQGRVQQLMHLLKYGNKPEVGQYLGKLYGYSLAAVPSLADVDVIVPVPLHPKKQRKRGYNQSEQIAMGLSKSMNKNLDTEHFLRVQFTETQTKKNRYARWKNVNDVFDVRSSTVFVDRHILLVDDVITTGATLEGCVNRLLRAGARKVSVVSLAVPQS